MNPIKILIRKDGVAIWIGHELEIYLGEIKMALSPVENGTGINTHFAKLIEL